MASEQWQIEEAHVVASEIETSRPRQVNERSSAGGQCAMPQIDEFAATRIALLGVRKNFFRFEVEKAHAHGAVAHDAFEVAYSAAAAEAFLGVEGHGDVAALPDTFDIGPAPVADAVADGPHTGELIELASGRGHAGGDGVSVVGDMHWGSDAPCGEGFCQILGEAHSFDLGQVGRVLDNAIADDAGNGDADGVYRYRFGGG